MYYADTDECMVWLVLYLLCCGAYYSSRQVPLFDRGTDGTSRKQKFIMGQRNWCRVKVVEGSGDLLFDIRVEKDKGSGQTTG
jgi:hypothetical protein